MNRFWSRLRLSLKARKDLDQLLSLAPSPQSALKERTSWFFDLLEWIRHEGIIKHDADFKSGTPQAARIRHLLNVLDRNEEWKKRVARALRSLFRDTHALNLFLETGLSNQSSFGGELVERIQKKFLPEAPQENDLAYLFSKNFHNQADIEWFRLLDGATFKRIEDLFRYDFSESEGAWHTLLADAEQALLLLAIQVQGLGLSHQIRQRIEEKDFKKISFYQLARLIEKFVSETDFELKAVLGAQIDRKAEACFATLTEVQEHLTEFGVSIQIVFQLDKIESLLKRIQKLSLILQHKDLEPTIFIIFVETLIIENLAKKSVSCFLSESFSLMSRKITERTAETGEHYITRNKLEYTQMIKNALGGGFLTAFTTFLKFLIYALGLPAFLSAFLASLNYAVSFLAIHFCHFSLATKQSAMTAPALAAQMHEINDVKARDRLIDEIINIIRSQVAAVFGNVAGVVPTVILGCWIFELIAQRETLSYEKSLHVLHDFSILGPTPLYAIFTGVLLWLSSLIAGWADNWFAYHRLTPAIAQNRRVVFIFGEARARALALFLKRNVVGMAGNISLGFLLGLTPAILQFIGIHLDVRHVTLSSGSIAAAMMSLPSNILGTWDFWLAVLGIVAMAFFNLFVSFYLAFMLAIRARKIQAPERGQIYKALFKRLLHHPSSLFWPREN